MGFWKIKGKVGRKKRERKKKNIDWGPTIIKERMALSYSVKLKSGKSCLRRLRPCESWKRESRIKTMFLMLPQKCIPMYICGWKN